MWEALMTHAKKSEKSYFQQREILRRREQLAEEGRDPSSRQQLVLNAITEHPGSSVENLTELLGFNKIYVARLVRALLDQCRVTVERRKETLNGTTHWRGYYFKA